MKCIECDNRFECEFYMKGYSCSGDLWRSVHLCDEQTEYEGMWEVKNIKSGKELLDSGITKFEVLNGVWVGVVNIRNRSPHVYCYDLNGTLVNSWQLRNNTSLNLKIKPLSYKSLSEKCKEEKELKLNLLFRVGDIVYVSNPDLKYEDEYGIREHKSFFGRVTEIEEFDNRQICITVNFPVTPNGCATEWTYNAEELSLASDLKNLTLEEFSNKFGVSILAEYLN